jgi:orotidine-5'-phosphate decarboxylase
VSFISALQARWEHSQSLLCVGLDPDPARLPEHLIGRKDAILEFCASIVDATADLACCFKPQIAYFASCSAEGQLRDLIQHIHAKHPGIPVILDAKRGDIGSTAEHYAKEAFERYNADALTVSPYMGSDSLEPYLRYGDRGLFILCRTSNAGGADLQELKLPGEHAFLYEHVAHLAATQWNKSGQIGLVVGATYPNEIARVRQLVGQMPLLVPGIGAQGGDIQATLSAGQTASGQGLLINSSRAILYASRAEDFAQAARRVAQKTRDEINLHRKVAV